MNEIMRYRQSKNNTKVFNYNYTDKIEKQKSYNFTIYTPERWMLRIKTQ